jgi:TPR repeat protein
MNLILKLILLISLCFLSGAGNTKSLLDKAKDGHPSSQFELAVKEISIEASFISDWLLIAALQDCQKAIDYLRKFSNDKILSTYELGLINQKNTEFLQAYSFITKVKKKDLNILRKKGNNGDVDTQYLMWYLYVNDKGVKKSEAYTWLKQAAGNNHPKALFGLGLLYYYGYIVPEEKDKAKILIQKSGRLGLNLASIFLESIFK